MFTKKEKESINDAILEERERIKKIIRDNILHNLVPKRVDYTTTISIDKFIQNLNDRIDNRFDYEKCKDCEHAYFNSHIVGGKLIDGKIWELGERDEYPSHCGYGLDGAVEIDDDFKCPKPE